MKTCTKCLIDQPLDQYKKQSATRDGLAYICKKCAKIAAQEYYKKNQEKLIDKTIQWREQHPEEYANYQKNYTRKL